MKRKLAVAMAAVLCLSVVTGCETETESGSASGNADVVTEYGIVTVVNGSEIELTLGEIEELSMEGAAGSASADAGQMPQGAEGELPEGTEEELPEVAEGEMPEGENGGKPDMQQASGDAAGAMGGRDAVMYQFTEGTETKTITIEDESILSITENQMGAQMGGSALSSLDSVEESDDSTEDENTDSTASENADVSLEDIAEGTILELSYDADGTLTAVTIRNDVFSEGTRNEDMGGDMQMPDGEAPQNDQGMESQDAKAQMQGNENQQQTEDSSTE